MWRFVILVIVAWVAFRLIKRALLLQSTKVKNKEEMSESANNTENMVKCVHCGVHLPVSEAFLVNKSFYCSKAHLPNANQ